MASPRVRGATSDLLARAEAARAKVVSEAPKRPTKAERLAEYRQELKKWQQDRLRDYGIAVVAVNEGRTPPTIYSDTAPRKPGAKDTAYDYALSSHQRNLARIDSDIKLLKLTSQDSISVSTD